ncbi:MAG: allantoinase AllB [Thermomicrobiales bacterium]
MKTLVIEGGTVVTDQEQFRADLVISGDHISAITLDARGLLADERIEAEGMLIMPGGIDAHTHFREPEEFTKEGFTTGSAAASAGGITTVVEMPQADPTTVSAEQFRAKRDQVGKTSFVDMALWAGIVGEPKQHADALREMAAEGAVAFKSFMATSSPSFPAVNEDQLFAAMGVVAEIGLPYGLHAEHDGMLQIGLQRLQRLGRKDPLAHAESRPPIIETIAVGTALLMAELTGCWVHICHVASADALRLIAEARGRGVRVTCETCPQYLALNTDDLLALRGFGRCAPAIREQEEVDAIWPYVMDETVDLICSDHAGLTFESKEAAADDIFKAPLGLSGAQTLLPVFYDSAVNQRGMAPTQFVRQMSTNPAQIFGLYPRKGTIALGSDADLVIFDPQREWIARGEEMFHKQKWTPFEGKTIIGRVRRSIRRGETTYDEMGAGEPLFPQQPGSGRFLPHGYGNRNGG